MSIFRSSLKYLNNMRFKKNEISLYYLNMQNYFMLKIKFVYILRCFYEKCNAIKGNRMRGNYFHMVNSLWLWRNLRIS